MDLTRRHLLAGFGGLAASGALPTPARAQRESTQTPAGAPLALPRKADFAIGEGHTYINCAYGYYMASSIATHFMPYDSPDREPLTFELSGNATGHFEVGSQANGAWASLSASLPYIRRLGVEHIEAYRQPMLRKLHKEMPALGFEPLTPGDSRSALITFAMKDAAPVQQRLKRARINARVGQHFLRLSPSVFNDMGDIDRLLDALSG